MEKCQHTLTLPKRLPTKVTEMTELRFKITSDASSHRGDTVPLPGYTTTTLHPHPHWLPALPATSPIGKRVFKY